MATSASHPLDKLPGWPTEVPGDEFDPVRHALEACRLMMQLTGQFAAATMLFDFCSDGINGEKSEQSTLVLPFAEGRRMAGRDAGMSIYHFGMAIEITRQFVCKRAWLRENLLDCKAAKEAKQMMNRSFPNWEGIRHAVAH